MKKLIFILTGLLILNCSHIYAGEGELAGITLLQPIGARAAAMGEAYSTARNDVFGINPAIPLDTMQAAFLYQRGIADDYFSAAGIGIPFGFGKIAAIVMYYNAGDIDLLDTSGQSRTVNAQSDVVSILSLSGDIGEFSLGGSFKMLKSKLVDELSTTAYMIDAGIRFTVFTNITLAAVVQNIGQDLKYLQTKEKLPSLMRGGISFGLPMPVGALITACDIVKLRDTDKLKQYIGAEYNLKYISLRAGHQFGYDDKEGDNCNTSFGAGLNVGNWGIDYAFTPFDELGTFHQISLSLKFGKTEDK